jgi:hypothetical protein
MEAAGVAYSVPLVYRLKGRLIVEQLENCLNTIISRHEILRTHFEQQDTGIVQVISPQLYFELTVIDVRDFAASERMEHIQQLILEDVYQKFDLAQGPLMRGRLFHEDEDCYFLYLSFHHIILDEWSLEKLILELELIIVQDIRSNESTLSFLYISRISPAGHAGSWMQGNSPPA